MQKELTLQETAEILGISNATVLNWVKQDFLKPITLRDSLFFDQNEVLLLRKNIRKGKLQRLQKRANKSNSSRKFLPDEYMDHPKYLPVFNTIMDYISRKKLRLEECIFCLSLNLLKRENLIESIFFNDLNDFENKHFPVPSLKKILCDWFKELYFDDPASYELLLQIDLPPSRDIVGIFYQSLISEGDKARSGTYYTPKSIADSIASDYLSGQQSMPKILDPCCGTGQFLLATADTLLEEEIDIHPEYFWGFDIDPIAVKIARINLLTRFEKYDFIPNIHVLDVIGTMDSPKKPIPDGGFDLILSNPPWGAHIQVQQSNLFKESYSLIRNIESFSYFIYFAMGMLNDTGILSFILPESIMNIKTHAGIRNFILDKSRILKIECLGKIFKGVYTSVIRLDLIKNKEEQTHCRVITPKKTYQVEQARFKKNEYSLFDIYTSPEEEEILHKIYSFEKNMYLSAHAKWALGIVTGNNEKYLSRNPGKNYKTLITGKAIEPYLFNEKEIQYLHFEPEKFQQKAPMEYYFAEEKLLYKFISRKLVFAYDNQQHLCLNSANILIPDSKYYSIFMILALFNSSLYQFLFYKKFFTQKVLRSHLERLPLPLFRASLMKKIESLVRDIIGSPSGKMQRSICMQEIDSLMYQGFLLSDREIAMIEDFRY
jgi:type I restriction-modification system DNA methylase subunit